MQIMKQRRKIFFSDPEYPATMGLGVAKPSLDEVKQRVQAGFQQIVGQDHAKRKLGRAAVNALLRFDHNCGDINFLVTGPSSVGKTTLVRAFAQIIDIPMVEVSPRSIKSVDDVFLQIKSVLESYSPSLPLVPVGAPDCYRCPPMIIFVDEAHALRSNLQDGLLKAIENNDRQLQTENGDNIDCSNVCWIFATTEVGDLFGPLLNRFSVLDLKPYSKNQVAHIVWNRYIHRLPLNVCELIAHYEGRVPRRALDFAKEVVMEQQQGNKNSLHDICHEIAHENGIDKFGLHEKHVKVLKVLAEKPISKERLAMTLQVSKEELERIIMPPILCETEDMPALVTVSRQGYLITEAGVAELAKRQIKLAVVNG